MTGNKAVGLVIALGSCLPAWADPDWSTMPFTTHEAYQAVNSNGFGTFPTISPVKMKGVILNHPRDMLDVATGADPFMGGQWQVFIQAAEAGDFGGTAMWMGQYIGKVSGNHPDGSYTDAEWLAELDRLSRDPAAGRLFRPGDLVEVRARAPGLFFRGKTNINEQHQKTPEADFDIVLLEAGHGLPEPHEVALADLKDASNKFIFDATRATGPEHYQGAAVRFSNVSFTDPQAWGPGAGLAVQDGSGRTFPVVLGRSDGFIRYPPPIAPFDIVGILNQEDADESDGYKAGYHLWVMDYDGEDFVLFRYVRPDFDQDGDVDRFDFEHFAACVTGPAVPQTDPDCLDADFDGDGDVDQKDFAVFQRCRTGEDGLADPDCDR